MYLLWGSIIVLIIFGVTLFLMGDVLWGGGAVVVAILITLIVKNVID